MTERLDTETVIGRLMQFQGLLRRHLAHSRRREAPWTDPRQGQGRVLALLRLTPEVTQKELGFLLDISKQALGELLGKLQQRGFIEREPSAEDRRVTVIKLTETGRLAAESVDSAQTRNSRFGFLEVLNDEELARFNDYLNRMIAHLEQQLGVDSLDERRRMREDFGRRRGGHGGHGGRRPRGPGDPRHPGFFPDPFFPHGGDGGPERFEPGPGEEDR